MNSVVAGCRHVVQMEQALAGGETVVQPGLGPLAAPGILDGGCPLAMPNLWGHRNHLAQVLRSDPSIYQQLHSVKTATGVSFAQVAKPGMEVRSSSPKEAMPLGMVAVDAESYQAFARAFGPCIEAYHGLKLTGPHPSGLDPAVVEGGMIKAPAGNVIVRIRASRNLGGVRMPSACSFDERREVERTVVGALSELSGALEGEYYPLAASGSYPAKPKGMLPSDAKDLEAAGVLFKEPKAHQQLAAGFGRDWPDARGVFASDDRGFAAWVNEEEHVTLLSTRKDGDLKAAFASLCAAEKALGLALQQDGYSFAHCDRLGYLTAMPERLGTGITISVTLPLPNLAGKPELAQLCAANGLRVASTGRGGAVEVVSQATLGVSEAAVVSATAAACSQLLRAEG